MSESRSPVEDHLRRPGRDDAAVDERRLLEALRRTDQVMGRGDDRLAGAGLALEHVHQLFLGRGVDPGHGLVEEVQLRLGGDRLGEEDPPALAARQGADLSIPEAGHADGLERGVDPVPVVGRRPAAEAETGVAAHHRDLRDGHREVPVDRLGLGDVGDLVGARAGRPAEDRDAARERLEEPRDHLQEGALAGAVRPDDREERSAPDVERDVGEGDAAAVAGGDVDEADGGTGIEDGAGGAAWADDEPVAGEPVVVGRVIGGRRRSAACSTASCRDRCPPGPARGRRCRGS